MVSEAFFSYNEGAITITELSSAFAVLLDNITEGNKKIIDSGAGLSVAQDNIQSVVESYAKLSKEIELGVVTLEESVPEMISLFQELARNIEESINSSHEVIMTGLFGTFGEALGYADKQLTDYAAASYGVTQASAETIRELKQTMADLEASYNAGEISINDFKTSYSSAWQELLKYTSNDKIVNAFTGINSALQGIDWESPTAAQDAFAIVSDAALSAKQSVVDAAETMELALNEKIQEAYANGQTESAQALESMLGDVPKFIEQQNNEIENLVGQYADILQVSLVEGVQSAIDAAVETWNDMPPWKQIFIYGGKEYRYINAAIKTYTNEIGGQLSGDLQEQLKKVGYNGSFWALEALEKITDFSDIRTIAFGEGLQFDLTEFKSALSSVTENEVSVVKAKLDKTINEAGFDKSGNLIAKTIADGVRSGVGLISDAVRDVIREAEVTAGISTSSVGSSAGASRSSVNLASPTQGVQIPHYDVTSTAGRVRAFMGPETGAALVTQMSDRTAVAHDSQSSLSSGVSDANKDVVNVVYAMAAQIVRAIEDKDLSVNLDGEKIARTTNPYLNKINRLQGQSLVHK